MYGMICFNALSPEQQEFLIVEGYLPWGWRPEGTACDKPADVEVVTIWDRTPGPRYYCVSCAIGYLVGLELSPASRTMTE